MLGGQSILFQQQDFLEKQAGGDDGKLQQCFTTLMQNWVTSYQKSRLRARMACRPLFGEGSDARPLAFPKQFAPVPPPLVKPKKRDLDEEMRQLEKALAGSADGESEDDVRPLESVKTVAAGRRGALQLLKGAQLDLTSTIGKKVGTDTQSERKVGAVPTLPGETPRGATTPGASTIFHQMSVKEASVYGGTEGTSMSGLENLSEPSGDFLSPAFGMMPKKDALQKVFQRVADDGEVHKDALPKSLELLGIRHIKPDWVSAILSNVTRFTTLSFEEFNVFVHAYVERQSREYETAFFELDKDGSGTIEAEELGTLLRNLGITPMEQVIQELTQEFDRDNSGDIGLEEFCGLVAVIDEREGFSKAEYERFKHAFEIFSDEFGSLSTDAAAGILSFLSYEMSPEVVEKLVVAVDVDCSGTLSFPEYLFLMRKVRERETQRLEEEIQRLIRCGVNDKEDLLTSLLRVLGYVPDQEAVRDAAADANVNLGGVTAPRRNSGQMMATPTTKRVSMEQQELASLRVVTMGSQATVTQKVVTLSEAYRFLEVYRLREGFTKTEFAELQEWFDKYREEEPETDAGAPLISCFDASRAISRMGYSFTHEEHQLMFTEVDIDSSGTVNFSRFLKLVRKYRHKDLDQIRASLLKMGIVGTGASCNDGRQVLKSSMQFLGMNDPTESMNIPRSRTERTPAQKMKDAEDAKYGALRTAVAKRNQLRVIAQHHHGFDAAEVNLLRKRFLEFDSDGSGSIQSTELRALIKEIWPQMCSDPKYRPELIRILREVDTSDDGKVSFDEFLGLSRECQDAYRKEKGKKEQEAREQLNFTPAQVKGFREILVENDIEGKDVIAFPMVVQLINSLVPLGDRRVQQLAELLQKRTHANTSSPDMEEWTVDLPDFLKLMNAVLECDFAGIKVKSSQIAADLERAKEREKVRQKKSGAESALTRLSTLSSSSSESVFDALAAPAGDSDPD